MKIYNTQKKISESEIIEFEVEYQLELPNTYRELLLKYNGIYHASKEIEDLHCLFSIKHGTLTLEKMITSLQIAEETLPKEYLPIGNNATGDIISLSLVDTQENGYVYMFRHDTGEFRLLEKSLHEFLNVNSFDDIILEEDDS